MKEINIDKLLNIIEDKNEKTEYDIDEALNVKKPTDFNWER